MKTSEQGKDFIRSFEKLRLVAYDDGTGVWTIGWGHTGLDIKQGMQWSVMKSEQQFAIDVAYFEGGVSSLVKVPVTQGQFDALVSFAFNVGLDIDADTKAEGLGDSTLLRLLNAGDMAGAANEFLKWNRAGGRVLGGLTRRREAERAMFIGDQHA